MTNTRRISRQRKERSKSARDLDQVILAACKRLRLNKPVRRNLPGGGRFRMDRQLPFLCIYRSPSDRDDVGTSDLVTTEAAYLFASGEKQFHDALSGLCQRIKESMQEHFGTFIFLEVWAQEIESDSNFGDMRATDGGPVFEIVASEPAAIPHTIEVFKTALEAITIHGHSARVTVRPSEVIVPPDLLPLNRFCFERGGADGGARYCVLGLAVKPIYSDAQHGILYPMVLQSLRSQLAGAIRKAIASFTGGNAEATRVDFHSLGPSSMAKVARLVDQQLCEVSESFDFILQATPINSEAAWQEFSHSHHRQSPTFQYRPLPYHPRLLKRHLFDIAIERIEDPTLAHLFWEKQVELDRQLTTLNDLNTPNFLYSSHQLYGAPDADLITLARDLLVTTGRAIARRRSTFEDDCSPGGHVPVREVVDRARQEIDYYHRRLPAFNASVELCDHIAAGMMVSRGKLLVSNHLKLGSENVVPLLHHEIGTHLLTYYNGRCQPLRQLYTGLAGYDELQEGLAVLAEYLGGRLSVARIRTFAGRVIAVATMASGKSFLETYQQLCDEFHFSARQSFVTSLRAHRGGGLTKDIIYLRGLRDLLKYLEGGHDLEPLYVGKISLTHLPYVQELRRRGIIQPPSVLPRFWDDVKLRERLESCRGITVLQLCEQAQ